MVSQKKELLSCINDDGTPVESRFRGECHGNPGHLHRVVHVLVFDSDDRLLLQKRALTKDIQPGKWDTSVGGHVDPGESVHEAALRECREETGISDPDLELMYEYTWFNDIESERVTTFRARSKGEPQNDPDEVEEIGFFTDDEVQTLIDNNSVTPNFIYEMSLLERFRKDGELRDVDYPVYSLCRCRICDRLTEFRESISGRGKLVDADYWNRPVPGFGDLNANVLIIGLAPGAHGANRTGRPFTGDAAGNVLFKTLFDLGFCSHQEGVARGDGLHLKNVFISNAVKCVPPDNKPVTTEIRHCSQWLMKELSLLSRVRTIVCLGRLSYDAVKRVFKERYPDRSFWKSSEFSNGKIFETPGDLPILSGLYHPSRRNLNTGLITYESFCESFQGIMTASGI